jgi:hypothetical protein
MQLDVTSWPGAPGLLFESDTEEDLKGAFFMAGCRLEGASGTGGTLKTETSSKENGVAPMESSTVQPLSGKRAREEGP